MLKNKMLRDIRLNISQFLSIFLMVIIGVMVYTGIEGYMLGMEESASEYYNKNNDNKSNKNAKTIDEFNFSDITLLEIKNKNIINYIDDYNEISKYLFN